MAYGSPDNTSYENEEKVFKVNPFLWILPLVLSALGILMITSTTSTNSFIYTGAPFQMGIKQLQWLFIAIAGMIIVYSIPLRLWYKYSVHILVVTWLSAWLPLVPGVGASIGGARRWIHIPGISFSIQPGELLCLAVALHLAKLLSRDEKDTVRLFFRVFMLSAIAILPLFLQPDMGTMVLVFTVAMGMYVERVGWKMPLMFGGVSALMIVPALIFGEAYRMRRIAAWCDPWSDPLDSGFQAIQGLIAFANGGFWGAGMGHGFQKLNYLPAAYTDFIYAAIGEELGFIGTAGMILIFMFWLTQCKNIYYRAHDVFKLSLIWGVTLTIILPLVINVGGVTKLIPLTGMPLPFISYGGTALLTMWCRVGLVMRLDKESHEQEMLS